MLQHLCLRKKWSETKGKNVGRKAFLRGVETWIFIFLCLIYFYIICPWVLWCMWYLPALQNLYFVVISDFPCNVPNFISFFKERNPEAVYALEASTHRSIAGFNCWKPLWCFWKNSLFTKAPKWGSFKSEVKTLKAEFLLFISLVYRIPNHLWPVCMSLERSQSILTGSCSSEYALRFFQLL